MDGSVPVAPAAATRTPIVHYPALDGARGLGAMIVALYHARINSSVVDSPFVQSGHLFLDFFFALSGFVIAANYQHRITGGGVAWIFLQQRFWRLYPLHLAVLGVYVGLELVEWLFLDGRMGGTAGNAFTGTRSLPMLVSNLLMVHSLGIHDDLSWNFPSWSISTEFYAYVAFAIGMTLLGPPRIKWAALAVAISMPILLFVFNGPSIYTTYDFGYLRCVYGFAVGVLIWNLIKIVGHEGKLVFKRVAVANVAEILALVGVFGFMAFARGGITLLMPVVFAVGILLMTSGQGVCSRILSMRWMTLLGLWSYSIYMWHFLLIRDVVPVVAVGVERLTVITMFNRDGAVALLGVERWQGNLMLLAYMLAIAGIGALSYRWIEDPGQRYGKKWIKKAIAAHLAKTAPASGAA
jgi:peptidoglycan/LPS O-acetylase OafA/YrhL